jgi:hypothetical protein
LFAKILLERTRLHFGSEAQIQSKPTAPLRWQTAHSRAISTDFIPLRAHLTTCRDKKKKGSSDMNMSDEQEAR